MKTETGHDRVTTREFTRQCRVEQNAMSSEVFSKVTLLSDVAISVSKFLSVLL